MIEKELQRKDTLEFKCVSHLNINNTKGSTNKSFFSRRENKSDTQENKSFKLKCVVLYHHLFLFLIF
jgi:hypothetical protein